MVDASDVAMGALLQQKIDGNWLPLNFFSKKSRLTQKRCSLYDRELLAIYSAVDYFRYLMEAHCFTIYTNH